MVYNFLYVFILLIIGLFIFINIRAKKKREVFLKNRVELSIAKLHTTYDLKCSLKVFKRRWISFAKFLGIPPKILYPEDRLEDLKDIFSMSNIIYDIIDDYLILHDVKMEIFDTTTVIEIVKEVCVQRD